MDSGEILKVRAELLNTAKKNLAAAGYILNSMEMQNDFVVWSRDFRLFWKLLWKARRLMKKAVKFQKKYEKAVADNN